MRSGTMSAGTGGPFTLTATVVFVSVRIPDGGIRVTDGHTAAARLSVNVVVRRGIGMSVLMEHRARFGVRARGGRGPEGIAKPDGGGISIGIGENIGPA